MMFVQIFFKATASRRVAWRFIYSFITSEDLRYVFYASVSTW
jgi:hypothetical protein